MRVSLMNPAPSVTAATLKKGGGNREAKMYVLARGAIDWWGVFDFRKQNRMYSLLSATAAARE